MSVRGWSAAVVAALGVVTAGCGSPDDGPGPAPRTTSAQATQTTSATSVPFPAAVSAQQAALQFTQVVLPPGAVVLASQHKAGLDTLYGVVIRVDKSSVDELLKDSGFLKPLEKGRAVTLPPTGGIAPGTGDRIESAQDVLTQSMIREVLVDRTNPDEVRVHVWAHLT